MPVYRCKCGAKYKIPESATGRRVRCKKCDHTFTVPKSESEIAPLALAPLEDSGTFAPQFQPSPGGHSPSPAPALTEPRAAKGYMQSVLWAFLFPSNPGNLVTFLFLWFIFVLAGFTPFRIVALLAGFWYAAYKFSLILSGAAGDEDLPEIKYSGDFIDELIVPALKWFFSWVYVFFPLFAYSIIAGAPQGITNVIEIIVNGIDALFGAGVQDPIATGLIVFGMLFWPMAILCATIGGLGTLVRFDLMLITIAKSFGGYVVTLVLLAIATAIELVLEEFLATKGGASLSADAILANVIQVGLSLYVDIVLMRIIGLYYRHFKNKFAWDWG